jgi:predicted MPP superfamily phosphohydrolase
VKAVSVNIGVFLIFSLLCIQGCSVGTKAQAHKFESERPAAAPVGTSPERIILTWDSDPATTQAVTWRTCKPCDNSIAQIVPAASNPDFDKMPDSVKATSQPVRREDGSMVYYHSVSFHKLAPSTLYAYRVGDGIAFSEWNHFKTADVRLKPFKFIYFGDEQNDIKMKCSRVIRQAYSMAPDARFIIHAGDMVSTPDCDEQWEEWFDTAGWVFRTVPNIPIVGNHEYLIDMPDRTHKTFTNISRFWQAQFTLPLNGPADLKEIVYYLDYEGVRFIALSGSKQLDEQSTWLEPVLANNPNRWTIVVIHQPVFSTAKDRDRHEIQTAFENLFDKYKVDLVLQGHDHTYARSHKVFGGEVVGDNHSGTVYCTSVTGPKQYSWNPLHEKLMAKFGTDAQLFQIITIEANMLSYQSISATGQLFDSFQIQKDDDGLSKLVEPQRK